MTEAVDGYSGLDDNRFVRGDTCDYAQAPRDADTMPMKHVHAMVRLMVAMGLRPRLSVNQ
jgi:hypothetical protein